MRFTVRLTAGATEICKNRLRDMYGCHHQIDGEVEQAKEVYRGYSMKLFCSFKDFRSRAPVL